MFGNKSRLTRLGRNSILLSRMLNPKDLKPFRFSGKSMVFISVDGDIYYATKRVANEILSAQLDESEKLNLTFTMWNDQKWLCTPSRF